MEPTIGNILYLARTSLKYTKKDICCGCVRTLHFQDMKRVSEFRQKRCDIFSATRSRFREN